MKKLIPANGFGTVQRDVMKMKMSAYSKLVYCLLMTYKGDKDACYPSMSTICSDLEISKSTVIRAIKELEENNLLYVTRGKKDTGGNAVNKYIPDVLYQEIHIDSMDKNDGGGGTPQTPGGTPQTPGVVSQVDHKNNNKKNNKEEYMESSDSTGTNSSKRSAVTKKFIPPTSAEVEEYFLEKGYTKDSAKKAFDYYSAGNWKDASGKQVKNWKQKMVGVWFKEENKIKLNSSSSHSKMVW